MKKFRAIGRILWIAVIIIVALSTILSFVPALFL